MAAKPSLRRETWTDPSTGALIDAWEHRFLRLNRGVLRRKDWDEIAACVNRTRRPLPPVTHAQCRNRVDALKRRLRLERSRSPSLWPFYRRLDLLVGASAAGEAPIAADLDLDLATAVAGLAEVYERTEKERLRLAAELERQRLEFSREIEAKTLELFVEAQLELMKVKPNPKPKLNSSGNDRSEL